MAKKAQKNDFEVQMPSAPRPIEAKTQERSVISEMSVAEMAAVAQYDPANGTYSTVLSDGSTAVTLTQDDVENYSVSPQSDKQKTVSIIGVIRQYVNKDDIIGLVVEAIENNVNAKYRLLWRDARHKGVDKNANEQAKKIIAEFNDKINLSNLIRKNTVTTYRDGTDIMCLRSNGRGPEGNNLIGDYVVDHYPIGVAEISQYKVNDDPYVLIDINELKARLRKSYTKTKKNKPLFYENEEKEIQATYPLEVQQAYKNGEKQAKLNISYTGVNRINNQDMQYGLSPIFRALPSVIMLENFAKADRMAVKARQKKIIAQYMNKEILGPTYREDTYKQQAYAHNTLMAAWTNPIVVVTAPATVREIAYVEPKGELTNTETVADYRKRETSTLGISVFADGNASMSLSNINIKQLMKTINKITMNLETILEKWYKVVLQEAGVDPFYAPKIQVIDAEMMEMDLRMELANMLFSKLNCSYETVFDVLGYSVEDERARREAENEEGLDEIFMPRLTAYTNSGGGSGAKLDPDNKGGRPSAKNPDDPDKQIEDKQRNEQK